METQLIGLHTPVPKGLLFLYYHSASQVDIPTYVEGKTVAFSNTAISIATISDIDGETEITFTDSDERAFNPSEEIFSGQIFLENGALHLCIMGDDSIARLKMSKGYVNVSIFSNSALFPTSILVVAKNSRETTR